MRDVGIGHNQPPEDTPMILAGQLLDDYADLKRRATALIGAFDRAPEVVDDNSAGRVADSVKQIQAHVKKIEANRKDEKEPHLSAGRVVDTFFNSISDPLERAAGLLKGRLTTYERAKAQAERRRREEEEMKRREEEREARENAAKAERERLAAVRSEELAREERRRVELDAKAAKRVVKEAKADVIKASRESDAKAAALHTTRGDYGSASSLRTFWDFEYQDVREVDIVALRHHLPVDCFDKAIRSFVKAGGRELKGVRIFENSRSVVR